MQFLASLPTFGRDQAAKNLRERFEEILGDLDGICYYKNPVIASVTKMVPELTILAYGFQPIAIKTFEHGLEDITSVDQVSWELRIWTIDSPLLDLEDYVLGLQHKFDRERSLRGIFKARGAIAFPFINRAEFEEKFGPLESEHISFIWSDLNVEDLLLPIEPAPRQQEWLLAKSVFQGISPLNKSGANAQKIAGTFGEAIRLLEKEIALLDEEQHKVAIQIAPGPQRIRGLAGTGKTIVLAMKAANIHLHFPDKRILFTFNTQSLYNQAKNLITKFYRMQSDDDPDWEMLHVQHGWGAANRPGVYREICKRYAVTPMRLSDARAIDPDVPLRPCCIQALSLPIRPMYDYILVDEAQDFPAEYFQLLYRLATENKCIYWAYDELQSLSAVDVPSPAGLFGADRHGRPLVSLDGEDYEGGIEKDFVLHRSYRCPQEILMLAHAIGLGIHSSRGCVQMLANRTSWTSIGYEIDSGNLTRGEDMVIFRPPQNSPNRIGEIYTGKQELIRVRTFTNREEELKWVAKSIYEDITVEKVRPEQIVVISLDGRQQKNYSLILRKTLMTYGINAIIPGPVDDTDKFAESDMVTLSTVHRAKGNEAPVVYIISFDSLYEYTEEIVRRNQAFAAISRSKGWVRITGAGRQMQAAEAEIRQILSDIPYLKFKFPDMEKIKRLDASETSRRRREVRTAKDSVSRLLDVDDEALNALSPALRKELKSKLDKLDDDDEDF
jgi:superfamily I DNA and RNA helicase